MGKHDHVTEDQIRGNKADGDGNAKCRGCGKVFPISEYGIVYDSRRQDCFRYKTCKICLGERKKRHDDARRIGLTAKPRPVILPDEYPTYREIIVEKLRYSMKRMGLDLDKYREKLQREIEEEKQSTSYEQAEA